VYNNQYNNLSKEGTVMKHIHSVILAFSLVGLVLSPASLLIAGKPQLAAYHEPAADQFMTEWIIPSPISVFSVDPDNKEEELQKRVFAADLLEKVGGEAGLDFTVISKKDQAITWRTIKSDNFAIDLIKEFGEKEFAVIYAYTEINVSVEQKVLLGIGSDDGVKVWLNGKLIHENWLSRGVQADNDLVPAILQQGVNRLLLKVQNIQGEWGFACRIMSKTSLADKVVNAAELGDLDKFKMLLDYGVDINIKGVNGLTPYQAAQIKGRADIQQFLLEKGADTSVAMPTARELTDNQFNHFFNNKTSGAAVLVARNGEILYQNGYGMQNIKKRLPVTPETEFRIGSITKQFTAAAILKLQEEGKLSVTDKLSKYYPDFPRGDEVTIHHLLTHISGIHSYTNSPGFLSNVEKTIKSPDLIEIIKTDPYDFDPGEQWKYNNSGYFILGHIIEQVSGLSYNDFLRINFFEPLGMHNTGVHYKGIKLEHEAAGYSFEGSSCNLALNWDMSWAGGAGNLYSTVGDLFKWNEGLYSGQVLNESSLQAAFTPVKLNNGDIPQEVGKYGYGLVIEEFRGVKRIGHGSGLNGFSTYLVRFPKLNITVIVLSNAQPGAPGFSPNNAMLDITEFFFYPELASRNSLVTDKSVDPKTYPDFVGRYDYTRGVMEFTVENDKLYAQFTGQGKAEVFPAGQDEFFWKAVEARVKFLRDENGKVSHVVHYQGGQEIKAPRLVDTPVAPVDPAIYDSYVGDYQLAPNFILTISKENNRLYTQATGQGRFEIFPSSETEYFLKVAKAEITFNKDESGKVVSLTLHQAGRDMQAPKK